MNDKLKTWSVVRFALLVYAISTLLTGCYRYGGRDYDRDRDEHREHDRGDWHHEDEHR